MRTPDKNRILRAVRHLENAEIPLLEITPDIAIANQILGREFPLSRQAYELPVPDYVELNLRMGNDLLYFADIWRLGRKEMTDAEGRIHYIDGVMKTPDTLADIWFPDLDAIERRLEETLSAIEGTGLGMMCAARHAPSAVSVMVGIQDYWIGLIDQPEFIHEFQRLIQEYCQHELELFARYPVDAIMLGLNIGMKSGPMCSPEMLEEFHYPALREMIDIARSHDLAAWVHVDGDAAKMIPAFIDMQADVLHPLEPCGGAQDIYAVKQRCGEHLALHGNIDVAGVLAHGTPEEVREDTVAHMEQLGVGGGYIVGSSHDLNATIPVENFFAMRDAVHDFRLAN